MSKAKYNPEARDGDKDGLVQDGTEFERPEGYVLGAVDGDGDGLVQDGTEFERPVEQADEIVVTSAAAAKTKSKKVADVAAQQNVDSEVVVSLGRLVFENIYSKNSASVITVQERLIELGFITAGDDKRGWLSTGTCAALKEFQKKNKIESEHCTSEETIRELFAKTSVAVTL